MTKTKRFAGWVISGLAQVSARLVAALLVLMVLTWGCSRLNEQAGTPRTIGVAKRDVERNTDSPGEYRQYGYDAGRGDAGRQGYRVTRPAHGRYEDSAQGDQYGREKRYPPAQQQRRAEVADSYGYTQGYDNRSEPSDEYRRAESYDRDFRDGRRRRQRDEGYGRDYAERTGRIEYVPTTQLRDGSIEKSDVGVLQPMQAPAVTGVTVSAADRSADKTVSQETLFVTTPPPATDTMTEVTTMAVPALNTQTPMLETVSVNRAVRSRQGGISGAVE